MKYRFFSVNLVLRYVGCFLWRFHFWGDNWWTSQMKILDIDEVLCEKDRKKAGNLFFILLIYTQELKNFLLIHFCFLEKKSHLFIINNNTSISVSFLWHLWSCISHYTFSGWQQLCKSVTRMPQDYKIHCITSVFSCHI